MAHIFTCLSAEQQDFEMSLKESLFLVGVSQFTTIILTLLTMIIDIVLITL